VITVVAGKPSELAFKLSKTSMVPVGTITFKVTNMGVAFHDFKVCTIPVPTAAGVQNACFGKSTPTLKHGQSATLTVPISLAGKYEFLCTIPGHAAAGMKGLLGVGVVVAPTEQLTAAHAGTQSGGGGGVTTTTKPGSGGASGGDTSGCPPGVTIRSSGAADADGDELGTEPDDNDGCV
jgi:plastocyanin